MVPVSSSRPSASPLLLSYRFLIPLSLLSCALLLLVLLAAHGCHCLLVCLTCLRYWFVGQFVSQSFDQSVCQSVSLSHGKVIAMSGDCLFLQLRAACFGQASHARTTQRPNGNGVRNNTAFHTMCTLSVGFAATFCSDTMCTVWGNCTYVLFRHKGPIGV